jgi:hypothetical protein
MLSTKRDPLAGRLVYQRDVIGLKKKYSVWEEAELVTGCIHKWHKLLKRKHADVREQIGREMGEIWRRLRADFFWSLVPEVRSTWPISEDIRVSSVDGTTRLSGTKLLPATLQQCVGLLRLYI